MMNTIRLFRISVACLAALLALAPTGSAFAMPPTHETFQYTYVTGGICGTYNIVLPVQGESQVTTFYDSAGNPTQVLVLSREIGTVVTDPPTDKSLDYSLVYNVTYDLQQGTQFVRTGVRFAFNEPYHGVYTDAGMAIYDANYNVLDFSAHPHLILFSTLCDLLAP